MFRNSGYHPGRKIRIGLSGIKRAVLLDFSVRYKLVIAIIFLVVAAAFETIFHFLFVLTVTGLMLMAEVFNTVVEKLSDYVEPQQKQEIKDIKDMAAGAALVAIVIWWAVLLVVLFEVVTATDLFAPGGRLR